jgi:DNA primase catalytic core
MTRIPDADIERLKRNTSVTELCRSRGIELEKHGRKDLIGKCPFHQDTKPSFVVSPLKNLFHCMGCDAAGSVIDLVMKLDKLSFREAVDKLLGSTPKLKRASVPPVEEKETPVPPERATQLLERVLTIYEKTFIDVPEGRAYLEKRGITDAGLFTQHRIGYSNGRLKEILPTSGQIWNELKALGILLENGHERFTGCVVVPVCSENGNLVTLYGRYTGEGPKRHVFLPDRSTGLWNAAAMKTYSEIILVESVIDALSVMMAGQRNVIAVQGTNGLNETEIAALREHGVQSVSLLLDGDDPGKKAAVRLKEKLTSSFSCRTLTLPGGEDPNSFLQEFSAVKLAEFINHRVESGSATSTVRAGGGDGQTSSVSSEGTGKPQVPPGPFQPGGTPFCIACGLRRYEIRGLEKGARKLKATIRVEHAGKLHVDTLDFYSARARRVFCMDLCRVFEETPETIEADIGKLIKHCEQAPQPSAETSPPAVELMPACARREAEEFGRSPTLIERILADFEACGLVGEKHNKLLCYLALVSRKTDAPLSVLILSSSGAGKTALQDTAMRFCPDEDLVKLTSLSGKALFYKEQLSLKNKVLALEEGTGAEEAGYAIRNLITAGELIIESAIKDPMTGKITTMTNRVEGPTAVFITTTDPDTDAETKSRFFITSIDESREQTRAILSFQRRRHTLEGFAEQVKTDAIRKRHQNFQRLLKPLAVINPYAGELTYGDDRLQGRRDQPKYLNLIKAVALLRQMRKPVKAFSNNGSSFEYIEVDLEDIRIANELAREILGHSLDELSRPGRNLLLLLDEMIRARLKKEDTGDDSHRRNNIGFTRREIRDFTGWANARVHRYLRELADLEYVLVDAGRNGATYRYRLAYDGQGKDGSRFVLGLKDAKELKVE